MNETDQTQVNTGFMAKLGDHADNKKLISRIITFIILGIGIYEELFAGGIRDNWSELVKWCLLYYFGRSAVEKVAKYVGAKNSGVM